LDETSCSERPSEGHSHRDLGAVVGGNQGSGQALDVAENVVPAPAVRADAVLAWLVQISFELESGRQHVSISTVALITHDWAASATIGRKPNTSFHRRTSGGFPAEQIEIRR
jgi:hypothetical protein